jgi:hypothetical protein
MVPKVPAKAIVAILREEVGAAVPMAAVVEVMPVFLFATVELRKTHRLSVNASLAPAGAACRRAFSMFHAIQLLGVKVAWDICHEIRCFHL